MVDCRQARTWDRDQEDGVRSMQETGKDAFQRQNRQLKYDTKNDTASIKLRQKILRDLKTAKAPKTNLSKNQQKALKEQKSDENIKIYPLRQRRGTCTNL